MKISKHTAPNSCTPQSSQLAAAPLPQEYCKACLQSCFQSQFLCSIFLCFWLTMGDPGLLLILFSSLFLEKLLDICKKIRLSSKNQVFLSLRILSGRWHGLWRRLSVLALWKCFEMMELCVCFLKLITWKGAVICTVLLCLLNKTALLHLQSHSSLSAFLSAFPPVPRILVPRPVVANLWHMHCTGCLLSLKVLQGSTSLI